MSSTEAALSSKKTATLCRIRSDKMGMSSTTMLNVLDGYLVPLIRDGRLPDDQLPGVLDEAMLREGRMDVTVRA
jgi:hypothetical protein